jgi:hypothetical protein
VDLAGIEKTTSNQISINLSQESSDIDIEEKSPNFMK